jgi:hypothetical protein
MREEQGAMVLLCLMLIFLSSPSIAWGFSANVSGDIHGLRFVGTVKPTTPDPVPYPYVPEFCFDEENYTALHIHIQQAEALPGQKGMVVYKVPGWVRFPTPTSAVICIGFSNSKITLTKVGSIYVQDAATENETIAKVRVEPQ